MNLTAPKAANRNSKDEENSAITYLVWLRMVLKEAGGQMPASELEKSFLEEFSGTFSKADRKKWRNTLAWAVVSSRNEQLSAAMKNAGLASEGKVFIGRPEGRHSRPSYVIDTIPSQMLNTARQQLENRKVRSLKVKAAKAPYLDPKRPWLRCPLCAGWTYLGVARCVRCSERLPKNPRTKVFRRPSP